MNGLSFLPMTNVLNLTNKIRQKVSSNDRKSYFPIVLWTFFSISTICISFYVYVFESFLDNFVQKIAFFFVILLFYLS